MLRKTSTDEFLGAGLIAFSAILWYVILPYQVDQTHGPGLSAAFFPKLITCVLAILGAVLIGQNVWRKWRVRKETTPFQIQWDRDERNRSLMVIAVSIIYVYLIGAVGYLIATPLGLGGFMTVIGVRRWRTLFISMFLFTLIVWVLLGYFLKISLPRGRIFP